jgi:hypothetical protein
MGTFRHPGILKDFDGLTQVLDDLNERCGDPSVFAVFRGFSLFLTAQDRIRSPHIHREPLRPVRRMSLVSA